MATPTPHHPSRPLHLCIAYITRFGTITDPTLYTSLETCRDIIAVRQRDFSTTITVTVTEATTGEVLVQTEFARPDPGLFFQ